MQFAAEPPDVDEVHWIKERAGYNVLEGSWQNTRSIYVDGQHVGFFVMHRNYLSFMHIFKPLQRRGHGRAAVALLVARDPNIYLHSTPSARTFWERCGFQAGEEPGRRCVEMRLKKNLKKSEFLG